MSGGKSKSNQQSSTQDNRVLNELGVGSKQENIKLDNISTGANSSVNVNMRDDKAYDLLENVLSEANKVVQTSQENNSNMLTNLTGVLDENKNDKTQKNLLMLVAIGAGLFALVKLSK